MLTPPKVLRASLRFRSGGLSACFGERHGPAEPVLASPWPGESAILWVLPDILHVYFNSIAPGAASGAAERVALQSRA